MSGAWSFDYITCVETKVNECNTKINKLQGQQPQEQMQGRSGHVTNTGGQGNSGSSPTCQTCDKIGHLATICYYKYDSCHNNPGNFNHSNQWNFNNQGNNAAAAAFIASSETLVTPRGNSERNHITSDSDNLALKSNFYGKEQRTIGNSNHFEKLHARR